MSLSSYMDDLIDLSEDTLDTPTQSPPPTATTIGTLEEIPLTPAPPRVPATTSMTDPDPSTPLAISTSELQNILVMDKKEAQKQWEACLAEAADRNKYPPVPAVSSPFRSFNAMMEAKENGNYNEVNSMQYPTGPTKEHVALIQHFFHVRRMPLEQIAGILVEVYPDLQRGVRGGEEVERRKMVLGLVNLSVSMWAKRYDL